MADQLPAWHIHAITENVIHLAQQKQTQGMAAVRVREGVIGKTEPFQRMAATSMTETLVRDGDTVYQNPTLSKRRANLRDFTTAILVDDFDKVKTMTDPQSEFAMSLAWARNRTIDDLILGVAGLGTAGAAGTAVGGILGLATVVDEAAESSTATALPTAQQIVDGGTNLTMAKIAQAAFLMDAADVDPDGRYFFYSPAGMRKLITDNTVTSADYTTIKALRDGGFPQDATWMGFQWRRSTRLPITGNIRSCIAVQKRSVGFAVAMMAGVEIDRAVHKNNNTQVLLKFSGGGVRIEDVGVVQVNIDESV
jgi:Phage capsid protein